MKFKFQHNELVPDLPYIPKKVTNIAMVTYLLALVMCLIIYHLYALQWRWMLFGIIEVVGPGKASGPGLCGGDQRTR